MVTLFGHKSEAGSDMMTWLRS